MTIGLRTAVGARPHLVTVQGPGDPVPDGDGGYTEGWSNLDPPDLWVEIAVASRSAIERTLPVGTALATATHLVTGPFHAGVTTKSRLLFNGRVFSIGAVVNVDERSIEMVLVCTEPRP